MQTAFAQAVLDPAAPVPEGVIDPLGRPAPRRFDVYRNNVAASLVAALEDGFPVVQKLVGEAFFKAMALVYLREEPPDSPVLMGYGAGFPAFLERFPPVAHLGYLPDVARLDLALRESYHAADAEPVPIEVLARLGSEALLARRVRLAPSLRLLRSRWPVQSIWCANREDGPPPVTEPQDVLVLRPVFDPRPHRLGPGQGQVIAALLAGESLGAALEASPACDAGALLTVLMQNRAIVEILG